MRHPARPPRGTREQQEWLVRLIRKHLATDGEPTRSAFLATQDPDFGGASKQDIDDYPGRWGAALLAARGVNAPAPVARPADPPSYDVDLSDLDWDDEPTLPGTPRAAVLESPPAEPRAPEPRELLELRRTKARNAELERRLAETLEALHHADERAGVVAELHRAADPAPIVRRETASGLREATAVVLCSDWHVEEVVDPRAIEHRNAYSPEIARARVTRMAEGIVWLLGMHRERFALRDLVLWLGGDLLSGYIHDELEETNGLSPIEATLLAHELIAGLISTLLERGDLERIIVPCNVGNHGRTTKKMRTKSRIANSYEFLIYKNLEQRFANEPRVQFSVAGGSHLYLEVYDQTIRFLHGDDVRYWGGVGGITIPLNKALAAWESFRHADLTCIGHFHQLLHGRDFVVNGSLVGYSEFALSVKAQWEPPRQAFFLMDSRRGRCCATPLWVDDESESWRAA